MMKSVILCFIAFLLVVGCAGDKKSPEERPNILWIVVEDMSCHFGYNKEPLVNTPNVDRLAGEGIVYNNAYVSAPVCSASRSAMITGMYQTSIGAHHHRSSRGEMKIHLPEGIKTIPEYMSDAGYYTCNTNHNLDGKGKEDYNFVYSTEDLYDGIDWSGRAEGQPFFAQVQLRGGKLRNVPRWYEEVVAGLDPDILVSEEDVKLPPYYPDVEAFRHDWTIYLNAVQYTDVKVGQILKRLEQDGLMENTVVFFITDHGISQARGKQFLYDEGARIPFIIWAPESYRPEIREDLIIHIDMAATTLQLAGIEIPEYLDANPLLGDDYIPREYIVTARDRCDETVDHIRSVRRDNYKYIRNYLPMRPYLQPCRYKDNKPWMPVLRDLDRQGKLNEVQQLVTAKTRPAEELYNLSADPFEINNLADNVQYKEVLSQLRSDLEGWIAETGDKGINPESEEMYDSDMAVYLGRKENQEIKDNIALMKKWAEEGK
jgi:arylsulfatase A-like enzyme